MVYPNKFCSATGLSSEAPDFGRRVRNDMRKLHHCGVGPILLMEVDRES